MVVTHIIILLYNYIILLSGLLALDSQAVTSGTRRTAVHPRKPCFAGKATAIPNAAVPTTAVTTAAIPTTPIPTISV